MNYQPFVLVSHLRSGTHMLRSSLESHPAIRCQSEVFNSDNRELPYPLSTPTQEILDRWVYHEYPPAVQFVGFVLHAYHPRGLVLVPEVRENPRWDDVWTILADMPCLRVIHLKRRNLLRRHLSHLMARSTGTWHAWDAAGVQHVTHLGSRSPASETRSPAARRRQFTLDPRRLEADFLDVERARRRAGEALQHQATKEVIYEELCRDYHNVCEQLQDFLGVTPIRQLQPAVARLEHRPLQEAILNYGELKAHFKGSTWEAFFED